MSDAKSPQNLSMDEILATIRRIIAEDEKSSSTPGSAAARPAAVPVPPAPVPPAPEAPQGVSNGRAAGAPRETEQVSAEAAGADDVLDLTDALNEDGSVRHLAPPATASGAAALAPAPPLPEPAHTSPSAEIAAGTTTAEASPVNASPASASPGTDRAADPGPAPPEARPSGANDEQLVSELAALAAATAFGRLASVPRTRYEPPLVGNRPLDEIVCELLRPLLRTWLDEHLPGLVERLVQAEIAKISARSGPG